MEASLDWTLLQPQEDLTTMLEYYLNADEGVWSSNESDRPIAGGGAGWARPPPPTPPESFRLELNSATKVEFFY